MFCFTKINLCFSNFATHFGMYLYVNKWFINRKNKVLIYFKKKTLKALLRLIRRLHCFESGIGEKLSSDSSLRLKRV